MTQLDRQIKKTQHRLWLNRWLHRASFTIGVTAVVFAACVLVQRLFDLPIPLQWAGGALGGVALIVCSIWTIATREGPVVAAATLDGAAGLKERISSGYFCTGSDDAFAGAVVADAQNASASVTVGRHVRLTVPRSLAASTFSIILAALMFLVTPGLLKSAEAEADEQQETQIRETKVAVKRKMAQIREMTEANPALEELKEKLEALDKPPTGRIQKPEDVRHEAVKKIDTLSDAVKRKREDKKYDGVSEVRKALRQLKVPRSDDAPTQKLSKALAKGDFKSAKEEINKIKEQLATLKSEEDKEMAKQLSKRLNDLSKQLEKLAENKELRQELEQAGIKKEDVDRMLENLSKKDLDQVKKQLEQKGLGQKQIESLANKLQQQQKAGSAAKGLSKSLKKAAKCENPGQSGEAMGGLSQAADQLSDLETLEQEMSQLDSTIESLQQAKNELDNKPCPKCGGT